MRNAPVFPRQIGGGPCTMIEALYIGCCGRGCRLHAPYIQGNTEYPNQGTSPPNVPDIDRGPKCSRVCVLEIVRYHRQRSELRC